MFVGENPLTWHTNKHRVACSNVEAEDHAMVHSLIQPLRRYGSLLFFGTFKKKIPPMQMFCGNHVDIIIATNPDLHERTKHTEFNSYHI